MSRIDDYIKAVELSRNELSTKDPGEIADFSGAIFDTENRESGRFSMVFLNRTLSITWPGLVFYYEGSNEEIPIQQQVLLLHYMIGACSSEGLKSSGEWISFQDIPDGRFYMDAFIRRAKDPLLRTFGNQPEKMTESAFRLFNASAYDYGDHSIVVTALPLIKVALVLWEGDDEFPPEGNILFDKSISRILSAEDAVWLAGMIVYPMIGTVKTQ